MGQEEEEEKQDVKEDYRRQGGIGKGLKYLEGGLEGEIGGRGVSEENFRRNRGGRRNGKMRMDRNNAIDNYRIYISDAVDQLTKR